MIGQNFVDFFDYFADLQRFDGINVFDEFDPETAQGLFPFHFAGGHVVQIFFQLGGKVIFDIFFEEVFEKYGYDAAAVFGNETQFFDTDVFAFLKYGDNRCIGRRAADAEFFKLFNQARFGKARRRRGKVLFGNNVALADVFAVFDVRQYAVLVIVVAVVLAFLIKFQETVEIYDLSGSAEDDFFVGGGRIDNDLVQYSRVHLAGNGAFPDKLIKLVRVRIELDFQFFGRVGNMCRTNGFVRFLRVL